MIQVSNVSKISKYKESKKINVLYKKESSGGYCFTIVFLLKLRYGIQSFHQLNGFHSLFHIVYPKNVRSFLQRYGI